MTMRRMMFMAGGAVAPIALLALLFNNQWIIDATRGEVSYGKGLGPLLGTFQFTEWRLLPGRADWSHVFAADFTLLLFLALLALLVFVGARTIEPGRGMLGAVITGWWATTLAGGVAGLVGGALAAWRLDVSGSMISRVIWSAMFNGAGYGLLFGWIAGLGALGGFLLTRQRGLAPQPPSYGPQQPYGAQQPYGQQPFPQQPAQQPHPSAVPYVPPQGQPQQPPVWGAAPVPQQAGVPAPQHPGAPQQFGAPPVPPQQPPQPPQPAREQPAPPEPAADDRDEPQEPAPETPGAEAPADTPQDDDLGLADRTIVDRRREDD